MGQVGTPHHPVHFGASEGPMIRPDMVAPSPEEGESLIKVELLGAPEGPMIRTDMRTPSPEEDQSQVTPAVPHGATEGHMIRLGMETPSPMVDVSLGPTA